MGFLAPTRWTRAAAIAMTVLAVALLALMPRVSDVATYLGVLVGLGVTVAGYSAVKLWSGGMVARALAGVVCGMGVLGYALKLSVGLPGAGSMSGRVSTAGMFVLSLEVLVLVCLGVDAVCRAPAPDPKRPYAL